MLTGGQIIGQGVAFVRNVLVARMISPEDFGIAATLVLAVSMLGLISDLGVNRLLVQAEDGDEPVFQATAHAFQALRGIGIAIFLYLLAWPFSQLFGAPQALWAFQYVSLVPLIQGFTHLDPKRLHREFRFGPDVASELIPQIILVLAAWPLAWWFKDYSAMLWLLVCQSVSQVFASHLIARRRYTWAWNRLVFFRMCSFGWPILLNGMLMFLIFQGDRLIIGTVYDMKELGLYSVAFSITFIPFMMMTKVTSALLLPLLSRRRHDLEQFKAYYALTVCAVCLLGGALATGLIILGQHFIVLAYGVKYTGTDSFVGWLAIMHMLRTIRVVPTMASTAWGDTKTPLVANIARIALLPAGLVVALLGYPLVWLVVFGCLGEVGATTVLLTRLYCRRGLEIGLCFKPVVISTISVGAALIAVSAIGNGTWIVLSAGVVVITVSAFIAASFFLPNLRQTWRIAVGGS